MIYGRTILDRRFFIHKYWLKNKMTDLIDDQPKMLVLCAMFGNPTTTKGDVDDLVDYLVPFPAGKFRADRIVFKRLAAAPLSCG